MILMGNPQPSANVDLLVLLSVLFTGQMLVGAIELL